MKLLDTSIHSTLKNVFGFDVFRQGQAAAISKILDGKSALAVFPTGSGKSLCYQLSALHLNGLSLVVSPLIALMKDQIVAWPDLRKRAAKEPNRTRGYQSPLVKWWCARGSNTCSNASG